jgi:hypothetical protein
MLAYQCGEFAKKKKWLVGAGAGEIQVPWLLFAVDFG